MRYTAKHWTIVGMVIFLTAACSLNLRPVDSTALSRIHTHSLPQYFARQEPLDMQLSIYDVIARTIKYNLARRIAILEKTLSQKELAIAGYDLLPKLVINSGYSKRNRFDIRDSKNPDTGEVTPNPTSISSELEKTESNLGVSWDVLNFGLNIVRARQAGYRSQIAHERKRLAVLQLIGEVQESFWAAYTAQRYEPLFRQLEVELQRALDDLTSKESQTYIPLKSLNEQRRLLQLKRRVIDVRTELLRRKLQLANLMGLEPTTSYQLIVEHEYLPIHDLSVADLDRLSFIHRPEMRIGYYEGKVSVADAYANLLKLFPSLNLDNGYYHTSDELVVNPKWHLYSAQLSWKLLQLARLPNLWKTKKLKRTLAHEQQLSVGMSLLLQNRLAQLNYQQAIKAYASDLKLHHVESQILNTVLAARQAAFARATSIDEIRAKLNYIVAALDRSESYGRIHRNYFEVLRSVGYDILPRTLPSDTVGLLSSSIEASFKRLLDAQQIAHSQDLEQLAVTHPLFSLASQITHTWLEQKAFSEKIPLESELLPQREDSTQLFKHIEGFLATLPSPEHANLPLTLPQNLYLLSNYRLLVDNNTQQNIPLISADKLYHFFN